MLFCLSLKCAFKFCLLTYVCVGDEGGHACEHQRTSGRILASVM